jgi:hypothetical protein
MRKLQGTAVAAVFGDGHRLTLKASTGAQIVMDLSAEAAAALASQLEPESNKPDQTSSSGASAAETTKPRRSRGR